MDYLMKGINMEILQKRLDDYFKFRMNAWMGTKMDLRKYINSGVYWNVHFGIREDWGWNYRSDFYVRVYWEVGK